ncbi:MULTISPECIES: class I SAM-dependent methyltransferase [unclassified Ruminococcus]|uniref:class I SAM-dependent methyltransferase n=1 Tax=unclassified Ruminococcus TaxID=2608920 RepID=UPI00210B417A|nr:MULTISPECIES: class I SAM-dependent methyltransferase [unclassified Ruminococcus]MCQ4022448.1 class I SAM-dependent methyltransferase [Ruminococcus sp. zg-924]MCQ4114776.1 class I SAM-dependent methyltransferase [Ruminococcus sp. zg-921]
MNEVNKTLFIPLYGKSQVSKKGIILKDPMAEKIWEKESFPIRGKSKSKWLTYNMAMRAKVFDDWTEEMLKQDKEAVVLHIGCGLDSRCQRIISPYKNWIDGDFPDVIALRKNYYEETDNYHMVNFDAANPENIKSLPNGNSAIVILEGVSMYLSNEQIKGFLLVLQEKYQRLHILMDVYTEFGAKASKYKNPVNDVGVTKLYGIDDFRPILQNTRIKLKSEHSLTPDRLVNELSGFDKFFFKMMFTGAMYKKIYRLYELKMVQ